MTTKVISNTSLNSVSGDYSATLNSLKADTKYYYTAYAVVSGTGQYAGDTKEIRASSYSYFTTPQASEVEPVVDEDWLELPYCKIGNNQVVNVVKYNSERNYTHMYDTQHYVSLWTAYPLEAKHMGSIKRPDEWTYNPAISSYDQPNLCSRSYYDSDTYSRGHMIPNASRNGIREMQLQTFYVTNSVPQVQNNFNSGVWSSLEESLQTIAESETIYIVTGVAFNKVGENKEIKYTRAKDPSGDEGDGEIKKCAIPNYFYKVVLKVNKSGSTVTGAKAVGFWFENKAYTGSYTNYSVSVDQVEAWTGFDFFVNLPDNLEAAAETNTSWDTFKNF